MAARKELFWLGIGVKTIDGKDYGAGMPLPVGSIGKDDLKKMIADGRVGEMISTVVEDARDNQIADLKAELAEVTIGAKKTIKGLEKDLKKAGSGDCEDCKEKGLRIVELDSEVGRLTGENTALSGDVEEKAALIGDLKTEVDRLTGELEEATKPAEEAK